MRKQPPRLRRTLAASVGRPSGRHARPPERAPWRARDGTRDLLAAARGQLAARLTRDRDWRFPGARLAEAGGALRHRAASSLAGPGGYRRPILAVTSRLSVTLLLAAVPLVIVPIAESPFASTVAPTEPGWTTVFSDAFSGAAGSGVDSAWTEDTGVQYHGAGCQANWATGEVDTATNSTANVSEDGDGHLNITPVDINGQWTSGRIETVADDFAAPAGGEMEVSASIKQPDPANGLGYWASFWMLGAGYRVSGAGTSGTMNCLSWPGTGEINVMEDVNALSEVSGTLHCGSTPGGPCNEDIGLTSGLQSCPGCQTGFNTYSVIINRTNPTDESITWYLNGTAFHTVTESQVGTAAWQAAVDHGFFLILEVGIGGNYPDGQCNCTTPSGQTTSGAAMSVASVAVYTSTGSGTSPQPSPAPTPTASATVQPTDPASASSPPTDPPPSSSPPSSTATGTPVPSSSMGAPSPSPSPSTSGHGGNSCTNPAQTSRRPRGEETTT
jgi:hypothetical protein